MNAQEQSSRLQSLAEQNGVPQSAVDFLAETKTPLAEAERLIRRAITESGV